MSTNPHTSGSRRNIIWKTPVIATYACVMHSPVESRDQFDNKQHGLKIKETLSRNSSKNNKDGRAATPALASRKKERQSRLPRHLVVYENHEANTTQLRRSACPFVVLCCLHLFTFHYGARVADGGYESVDTSIRALVEEE